MTCLITVKPLVILQTSDRLQTAMEGCDGLQQLLGGNRGWVYTSAMSIRSPYASILRTSAVAKGSFTCTTGTDSHDIQGIYPTAKDVISFKRQPTIYMTLLVTFTEPKRLQGF